MTLELPDWVNDLGEYYITEEAIRRRSANIDYTRLISFRQLLLDLVPGMEIIGETNDGVKFRYLDVKLYFNPLQLSSQVGLQKIVEETTNILCDMFNKAGLFGRVKPPERQKKELTYEELIELFI